MAMNFTKLKPFTMYAFQVEAVVLNNEGAKSNLLFIKTKEKGMYIRTWQWNISLAYTISLVFIGWLEYDIITELVRYQTVQLV